MIVYLDVSALVTRAEGLAWDFALRGSDAVQLASALTLARGRRRGNHARDIRP